MRSTPSHDPDLEISRSTFFGKITESNAMDIIHQILAENDDLRFEVIRLQEELATLRGEIERGDD
jgi:hypothetical protein